MPHIHVNRFLGIAPKLGRELLQSNQAQIARDAKLWSEKLRPYNGLGEPEELVKSGDIQTIYFAYDKWLHWNEDVNVARGPIADDSLEKLYFTGVGPMRVTTKNLHKLSGPGTSKPPSSYIAGIPAPTGTPVATDVGAGNVTGDNLVWVFTFVRKWSNGTVEEGPPSMISNALDIDTQKVSVTMPNDGMATPADYGITHKRLYRLSSGGEFFEVAEVPFATTVYVDDLAVQNLGAALTTDEYLPPPDDMIGLIELPNGLMAGFSGKTVLISEPYRPWAYPIANRYTMNWPVVAIGSVGTSIIVATTSYPYIGRGVDPAAYTFKREPGRYPCVSKRSMASSDLGAIWATPNGLAASDGTSVKLATKAFLTRDEWLRDFYPRTMHAVVHDGRYYGWFKKSVKEGVFVGGGVVLDWSEHAFLTTLSDYQYAAYSIPDEDELWVARKDDNLDNVVRQWEADISLPYTYQWKSKVFISEGLENFGWAQVFGDYGAGLSEQEIADLNKAIADAIAYNQTIQGELGGSINGGCGMLNNIAVNGDCRMKTLPSSLYITGAILFKYWANRKLKLTRYVFNNEPFPLPSGFRAEIHEFEVAGAVETTQVTLATTVEELAGV